MKPTKKMIIVLLSFIALLAHKSIGQVGLKASYVFAGDSVTGFDETKASSAALSQNLYGIEYKLYMYNQKRAYVKQKYNLKTEVTNKQFQKQQAALLKSMLIAGGGCNNEDFELATSQINAPGPVQGWVIQSGFTAGFQTCLPPTFSANNNYTVFSAPTIDPKIPGQISSYFDAQLTTAPAGNSFLKLNDATSGAKAARASKTFIVTSNNALFQYAYLPVIQDGSHGCCDQPGFDIKVTVTNTVTNTSTVLACPNISVAVPGAGCSFTVPPGGPVFIPAQGGNSWVYSNWISSAIDLSAYINFQIQIDVTVVDCTAGGHGAYIYFDAKCAPMTIVGNGNPFPAGTPSITLPTCGSSGATIVAPPGLGPYSWAGPGVNPPFTTPSMSNQTYSTNISGIYTLSMNPPGSCQPIIRVITVSITPAPQIFASVQQAPCGGTVAIASCTTAGSASVASTIVWSPNPVSINTPSTQATYLIGTGVVTVTASDPLGCMASATVNINSAPPTPTFVITNVTGSSSITCTHPCINYIAASNYTFGALTYTWVSLSSTASGTNVSICNAGQYTVTALDPVTGCSSFSVFAIGINTIAPTSTVTPLTQNITCPVTAPATFTGIVTSTLTNMQHCWFSSFSPGGSCNGGTVSIFNAGVGTYTYVVTNLLNGCTVTKTVNVTSTASAPTFSVGSSTNFTLGCGTKSTSVIQISNGASTIPPGSGPVSYTVVGPTSFAYPGGTVALSGNQNYTVNTPGNYIVIIKDNTNYCENAVPITIVQNTFAPNIGMIIATPTLTCRTPKTILQGTSTQAPNVSYNWQFPYFPNNTPNDTLTVFSTTNTTNPVTGTFTLTATDNNNLCKSTQTVTIMQNLFKPIPIITPTLALAITCNTLSYNLSNGSIYNPASPYAHPLPISAGWGGPPPQVTFTNSSTYTVYTPAGATNPYTMTVVDENNGCTAITTKTIGDNRVYPTVNNPSPSYLDCGANCTQIAPIITGTTTGFTYQWQPVPTASFSCFNCSVTCVNKVGEYKIIVTNTLNGCASEAEVEVINGVLTGDFNPSTVTGFAPLTVNFTNLTSSSLGTSSITSAWSFGNGNTQITNSVSISPSATYTNAGTYTITMYATKGTCTASVTKTITVELPSELEVPNVFTPNADNVNDIFFLKVQNVTDIHAYIFDRWGNQVYESTSSTGNIAWDGKSNSGKELPAGTYFYTIKATGKDGTTYDKNGTVSLFR